MSRGVFITIYGINNIGKSTHARLLTERLEKEGYDSVFIKYPVYNLEPTGPIIDDILRSHNVQPVSEEELQTLFMQNRKDFEPTLKKYLDEGKIVVAEDYTGTGIAWGTAKGLQQEWVENLNSGLFKEDFTILMVGSRKIEAKEKQHLHESDDDLVMNVDKILRKLGDKNGWHKVEVQDRISDTAKLIWSETGKFLKNFKQ